MTQKHRPRPCARPSLWHRLPPEPRSPCPLPPRPSTAATASVPALVNASGRQLTSLASRPQPSPGAWPPAARTPSGSSPTTSSAASPSPCSWGWRTPSESTRYPSCSATPAETSSASATTCPPCWSGGWTDSSSSAPARTHAPRSARTCPSPSSTPTPPPSTRRTARSSRTTGWPGAWPWSTWSLKDDAVSPSSRETPATVQPRLPPPAPSTPCTRPAWHHVAAGRCTETGARCGDAVAPGRR